MPFFLSCNTSASLESFCYCRAVYSVCYNSTHLVMLYYLVILFLLLYFTVFVPFLNLNSPTLFLCILSTSFLTNLSVVLTSLLLFPYVFFSISFLFLIPYVTQTSIRDGPYASCISFFLFTLISFVFYSISLLHFMISFLFLSAFYFISFPFLLHIIFIYTPLRIKRELSEFTSLAVDIWGSLSARVAFPSHLAVGVKQQVKWLLPSVHAHTSQSMCY